MRGRKAFVLLIAGLAVAGLAAQAIAGDAKGREVTVAHGRFAHYTWSLAVNHRHRHRCYALSLSGRSSASGTATCVPDRRPHPLFRQLLGVSEENRTVEMLETKERVRSMRLRIAHPRSDRSPHWTHVRNRRITRHQAHESGVTRDFRFAVLHSRGNLCVKRAVLFNRDGDRIDNRRVPCEF